MHKMDEGDTSLLIRLEVALHLFFCSRCAARIALLEAAEDLMRTGFFPEDSALEKSLEDAVMGRIAAEYGDQPFEEPDIPAEISLRRWVVSGFVLLLSLATVIFGLDFDRVAASYGSSYLLPVGITIGVVITGYGAMFIGSHLKELAERFGLR
jgi:hypothetical protein